MTPRSQILVRFVVLVVITAGGAARDGPFRSGRAVRLLARLVHGLRGLWGLG